MNYVLWQYKVGLVSSVKQFIFSSWAKKKKQSSKTAVTVIYDYDHIPMIYVFFKKKLNTEVLVYLLKYF